MPQQRDKKRCLLLHKNFEEGHLTELGKLRDEFRENKAWTAAGNMEVSRHSRAGV